MKLQKKYYNELIRDRILYIIDNIKNPINEQMKEYYKMELEHSLKQRKEYIEKNFRPYRKKQLTKL